MGKQSEPCFEDRDRSTTVLQWKEPDFQVDDSGRPIWTALDEDGRYQRLHDGCKISNSTFFGYNFAGVRLQGVTLHGINLIACRISNMEVQQSDLNSVSIRGCQGGPVFKESRVSNMTIEGLRDVDAVLRFFGSDVSKLLLKDSVCGLDFARTRGSDVSLRGLHLKGSVTIRSSDLSEFEIIQTIIEDAVVFNSTLIGIRMTQAEWRRGRISSVDMSCGSIRETSFESTQVDALGLDASSIKTLKLYKVHARNISATFAEWVDVEVKGGRLLARFRNCTLRSLMIYQAGIAIRMSGTVTFGLRLCEMWGCIAGRDTSWWRPVIRRSVIAGDGTNGVTIKGADCTNTKVLAEFATWLEI